MRNFAFRTICLTLAAGLFTALLDCPKLAAQSEEPGSQEKQRTDERGRKRRILGSKDYYLKMEQSQDPSKFQELARQKRAEEIEIAKGLIEAAQAESEAMADLPQGVEASEQVKDQNADLLLWLAELYWETAKDAYLTEMSQYLDAYDAWAESEDENKGPEPQEDHTTSRNYNRQAIETYRLILKDHPNYARLDEVYFKLAFNLMDLGEEQQALDYYNTLVKRFPNSEFVPDAYVQLGEYYFNNNNAFKALQYYRKAATYTDTRTAVFATYKAGWCYYNLGEPQKAIAAMKKVIAQSSDTAEQGKNSLREEALNDLVLFFSEAQDMEAAYAYFSKFGEKKHFSAMLRRLARTYLEQGKNQLAIETYQRLIDEDPMSPDAPSYQGEIIQAYFTWGYKQKTIEEIDKLVAKYGAGSEWAAANASNPRAIKEANKLIDRYLRNVAVDYHKEARKTGSTKTYHLARESYEKYLKLFPNSKYAYDIRFGYAEVLYALRLYDAAADAYEVVINMDPKGKYFQVAASSLLLAIDKMLAAEKRQAKGTATPTPSPDKGTPPAPQPLTQWQERKIKACDIFTSALPDHQDTPAIMYEAAKLYYDHNMFDKSTPRFMAIIEKYPKSEVAEVAANLVLDSFNQLKDWNQLDAYARRFHDMPDFRDAFKKELEVIYEQASFKKLEALEKTGDNAAAAQGFYAFYQEFPSSKLGDRALFNAAFYTFKTGDVFRSIELREELLAKFPDTPLMKQNLDALGRMYESIAAYDKAAHYYELLAAKDKERTFEGTADALYNAGLFRDALGEWEQAIVDYRAYTTDFSDREDAHLVALLIGHIYETNDHPEEALAAYKSYFTDPRLSRVDPDVTMEARLRYGRILLKQGDRRKAIKHFESSVALYERMEKAGTEFKVAPLYVAEMRFYMMEPLWEAYHKIRLDDPTGATLKRQLQAKIKLREKVRDGYTKVLQMRQGEWGIAALFMIGEVDRDLAQAILESPTPPQLTEDQAKLYRAGLEDQAFPLIDTAATAFEQALAKSYELGIYNEFTARANALLAELRPKEYPEMAELLGTPDKLSDSFYVSDFQL